MQPFPAVVRLYQGAGLNASNWPRHHEQRVVCGPFPENACKDDSDGDGFPDPEDCDDAYDDDQRHPGAVEKVTTVRDLDCNCVSHDAASVPSFKTNPYHCP